MSEKSAAVIHTFLDERRTNQQWQADRRREREAESRGDGRNEADKAEGPQRVHADFTLTRDLQQARVQDKQTRDRETREHDRGKSGRPANDESLGGFFGGARRCRQRAMDVYTGPRRELERVTVKWRSAVAQGETHFELARKHERRVESMLTSNARYILKNGDQKLKMHDMQKEIWANRDAIYALEDGLSPIEGRLAAALRASR